MNKPENYFSEIQNGHRSGPLSADVEISAHCATKCVTCNAWCTMGDAFEPTKESNIKMIDNIIATGVKAVRLTGGEPLMAPGFCEIVDLLNASRIRISITTTLQSKNQKIINALLKVHDIKVSLPVVEKDYESFFKIDNKHFKNIEKNLEFLTFYGKKVTINYVLFESNYKSEDIKKVNDWLYNKSLLVEKITLIPSLNDSKFFKDNFNFDATDEELGWIPTSIRDVRSIVEERQSNPSRCYMNKFNMYVKVNGDAYPCCIAGGEVDYSNNDKQLFLGNLLSDEKAYAGSCDQIRDIIIQQSDICKLCSKKYTRLNDSYYSFVSSSKEFKDI